MPVSFNYKVGTANNACWQSGSEFNGKIECQQTMITNIQKKWMALLQAHAENFGSTQINNISGLALMIPHVTI